VATGAAIIGRTGGETSPQHFGWGDAKVNVPPPLIAQNAYWGEKLQGFCIIKIHFLFSFRGAMPLWPPDQGLCPWTPLGAPPPTPHYSEEITATGWQQATYRNSAEHLAVDKEIHSFTAALDFDVLHWVDWTVATHDTSLTNWTSRGIALASPEVSMLVQWPLSE